MADKLTVSPTLAPARPASLRSAAPSPRGAASEPSKGVSVWGALWNITGTAKETAKNLVEPFKAVVQDSATNPHPIFVPLRNAIFAIFESLQARKYPSDEHYQQISIFLTPFLSSPEGYFRKIGELDEEAFQRHIEFLRKFADGVSQKKISLEDAINALDTINQFYHHELGPLGTVVDNVLQPFSYALQGGMRKLFSSRGASEASSVSALERLDQLALQQQRPVAAVPLIEDYQPLIDTVRDRLITNTTNYVVAHTILFSVCRLDLTNYIDPRTSKPYDPHSYVIHLIEEFSRSPDNSQSFYSVVAEHINGAKISFIRKLIAKMAYAFLQAPIHFYFSHFTHNIFNFFIEGIKGENSEKLTNLIFDTLKALTAVFSSINRAYTFIENPDNASKYGKQYPQIFRSDALISDRLTAFFESDLCGIPNTETTNTRFVRSFIDTFAPHFRWRAAIARTFSRIEFPDASLFAIFNTPLYCITAPISLVARAVIYIPEKVFDGIFIWALKRWSLKTQFIPKLREKIVPPRDGKRTEALLGDLYVHELNLFFLEQAQKLLQAMKMINGHGQPEASGDKIAIPPASAEQLRDCINAALTVLVKQDSTNLLTNLPTAVVSSAISTATQSLVVQLSPLFAQLTHANQAQEFIYLILLKLNETIFTLPKVVQQSDKDRTAKQLRACLMQIMRKAMRYATDERKIEEKYRLTAHKYTLAFQKATNTYISALRLSENGVSSFALWKKYLAEMQLLLEEAEIDENVHEAMYQNLLRLQEAYAAIQLRIHESLQFSGSLTQHLDELQTWSDALEPIISVKEILGSYIASLTDLSPEAEARAQLSTAVLARIKAAFEKAKEKQISFSGKTVAALEEIFKLIEALKKPGAEQAIIIAQIRTQIDSLEPVEPFQIVESFLLFSQLLKKGAFAAAPHLSPIITQLPNVLKKPYIVSPLINQGMRWFSNGHVN